MCLFQKAVGCQAPTIPREVLVGREWIKGASFFFGYIKISSCILSCGKFYFIQMYFELETFQKGIVMNFNMDDRLFVC